MFEAVNVQTHESQQSSSTYRSMDTEGEAFIIANMLKAEVNGEAINTQRNLGLESRVSSFEENDRPATHMIAHNSPSPSPQKQEGVACSSISLYKDD